MALTLASTILFPSGAPFTLNQSSELKARSLSSTGEWSALSSATFTVDATSLVISEIMYHPAQDSAAEFIEITNTSPFSVSLAGLTFSDGFAFDFDQHSSLQLLNSGESLLIVRDLATFRAVYGNTHDSIIAGTFQEDTGLSNGGETITLSDANGIDLTSITYNDRQPWPLEADGTGYSLIFTGGDPNIPTNWRPSTTLGGNPGSSDRIPFLAGNLLDYALLGSPSLTPTQFSWTTPLGADDVTFLVQTSPDLTTWTDLTLSFPLKHVYHTVMARSQRCHLRQTFPHADQVTPASKRTVTVFNIAGNHHRLITAIQ